MNRRHIQISIIVYDFKWMIWLSKKHIQNSKVTVPSANYQRDSFTIISRIFCCNLSLAIVIEKWCFKCISFANIVEISILFWIAPKSPAHVRTLYVQIGVANKFILYSVFHAYKMSGFCLFGEICTLLASPESIHTCIFFLSSFLFRSMENWRLHMINVIRSEAKIAVITATNKLNNVLNRTQWRRYTNLNHYHVTTNSYP